MGIQILFGNEPYVIMKRKNKVINALSNKQMNLQRFEGKFDQDVYNSCMIYPFMEDRRVVMLDVESLSALDNKLFLDYVDAPALSTELVVICKNVDKRVKLYKKLNSLSLLVPCNKLDPDTLKKAIQCELSHKGGNIQEVAYAEFIKRLNYENEEKVNMLSVVGYLDNMLAVDKAITLDMVTTYVPKFEEANVFGLSKLLLKEKSAELLKEVDMVDPDESIKTLSLLLRDFRIAYKLKYFEKSALAEKAGSMFTSYAEYSTEILVECMQIITETISDIKSGKTTNQIALKSACIKLFNQLKDERALKA